MPEPGVPRLTNRKDFMAAMNPVHGGPSAHWVGAVALNRPCGREPGRAVGATAPTSVRDPLQVQGELDVVVAGIFRSSRRQGLLDVVTAEIMGNGGLDLGVGFEG